MSWVYTLQKVAEDYGLDSTGTLDELRARVANHCRAKMVNPPRNEGTSQQTSPGKTATSARSSLAGILPGAGISLIASEPTSMERIRRWGTRYDGGLGAAEFLQRLGDLQYGYMVIPNHIIHSLSEILKGRALSWYRLRRTEW